MGKPAFGGDVWKSGHALLRRSARENQNQDTNALCNVANDLINSKRVVANIPLSLNNRYGGLAQLVERVLSMHEVGSSILPFSILLIAFWRGQP